MEELPDSKMLNPSNESAHTPILCLCEDIIESEEFEQYLRFQHNYSSNKIKLTVTDVISICRELNAQKPPSQIIKSYSITYDNLRAVKKTVVRAITSFASKKDLSDRNITPRQINYKDQAIKDRFMFFRQIPELCVGNVEITYLLQRNPHYHYLLLMLAMGYNPTQILRSVETGDNPIISTNRANLLTLSASLLNGFARGEFDGRAGRKLCRTLLFTRFVTTSQNWYLTIYPHTMMLNSIPAIISEVSQNTTPSFLIDLKKLYMKLPIYEKALLPKDLEDYIPNPYEVDPAKFLESHVDSGTPPILPLLFRKVILSTANMDNGIVELSKYLAGKTHYDDQSVILELYALRQYIEHALLTTSYSHHISSLFTENRAEDISQIGNLLSLEIKRIRELNGHS